MNCVGSQGRGAFNNDPGYRSYIPPTPLPCSPLSPGPCGAPGGWRGTTHTFYGKTIKSMVHMSNRQMAPVLNGRVDTGIRGHGHGRYAQHSVKYCNLTVPTWPWVFTPEFDEGEQELLMMSFCSFRHASSIASEVSVHSLGHHSSPGSALGHLLPGRDTRSPRPSPHSTTGYVGKCHEGVSGLKLIGMVKLSPHARASAMTRTRPRRADVWA